MAMRRRWVIGTIVGVGALSVMAAGVAYAASPSDDTAGTSLRDRVIEKAASILGIDSSKLDDALTQANKEVANEQRDAQIQKMVDDGRITQEQADQLKSWLDSRPEGLDGVVPGFGLGAFGPGPVGPGPGFGMPKPVVPGPGPVQPFRQFHGGRGFHFRGDAPYQWNRPPATPTPAPSDTNTSL